MSVPVLFKPCLRVVEGAEKAWGDTIWIMERLNDLREKDGHSLIEHKNVLQSVRAAMDKLPPEISRLNFQPSDYVDVRGKTQPLIRFSQDVLLNVCATIGGPVEHQLLYEANVELNLLREGKSTRRPSRLLSVLENGFQIIRSEFHDVRGEVRGIRDSLEDHKLDTTNRFAQVEKKIAELPQNRRKPRFPPNVQEKLRQVGHLDYNGLCPVSGVRIMDENGMLLPNAHLDHYNLERNTIKDGWYLDADVNWEARGFEYRKEIEPDFIVFQKKVTKRYPPEVSKPKLHTAFKPCTTRDKPLSKKMLRASGQTELPL